MILLVLAFFLCKNSYSVQFKFNSSQFIILLLVFRLLIKFRPCNFNGLDDVEPLFPPPIKTKKPNTPYTYGNKWSKGKGLACLKLTS